jgi:uncharacterized protein (DUF4415 family)
MNGKSSQKQSRTDWDALRTMTDEEINYSDIPPLGDSFFERARLRLPEEQGIVVTMRVDPDVFAWFNTQTDNWEQRMRAALRIYVEAHREQRVETDRGEPVYASHRAM